MCLGRLFLSHQFLDRLWSPWQQPLSQPIMDKPWPFLYKVRKAELDTEFFLCGIYWKVTWDLAGMMMWDKGLGGEKLETSARTNLYYQHFLCAFSLWETVGIANENGGITFFPVQVNVAGQAQAVAGSIQPLSAQALAGSLSSQPVTGTTLQVPGQVTIQQVSPGGQQQKQGPPLTSSSSRPRKTSSLSLFFRKVMLHVPLTGHELGKYVLDTQSLKCFCLSTRFTT